MNKFYLLFSLNFIFFLQGHLVNAGEIELELFKKRGEKVIFLVIIMIFYGLTILRVGFFLSTSIFLLQDTRVKKSKIIDII